MAFIAYGSYVPFHWRPRPWGEAVAAFEWVLRTRAVPDSRSDWAANVALGVPLGFALLGLLRVDRRGAGGTAVAAAAVVPACGLFAAAVEFGQLFFYGRTCSGSDVWAQGLGALVGAAAWAARGQWATDRLRSALAADAVKASTAPLLAGYAAAVGLVQGLPFDLTASPKEIYRRLTDPEKVTAVPFAELADRPGGRRVSDLKKVADWCELFALFVPAGLLATGLRGRFGTVNGLPFVAGCGVAGAAATELLQVLVMSRHASATDALIGGLGFTAGWAAGLAAADRGVRRRRTEVAVAAGQAWFALLAVVHWQPFDFYPALLAARVRVADWLPLAGQASKNYLWALNEVLSKFLLFVPLGAAAVWGSRRHHERSRAAGAAAVCGAAAAALELGQAMIPTRYFSPSDVLFGLVGGFLGGEVTRRVLGPPAGRVRVNPGVRPPAVAPPPLPPRRPGEPWWAAAERQFPGVAYPPDDRPAVPRSDSPGADGG
jgi:VanZ family protein